MRRVLLVTVVAIAGFVSSAAPEARVTSSEPGGRLAYSSRFWPKDRRIVDNWEIFVLRIGGVKSVRISRNPRCDEVSPAWSHDGRRIAFACGWGPSAGIFVMRDDGSERRTVVRLPNRRPNDVAWSRDGLMLAFALESGIWAVDIDGNGLRRLTRGRDSTPTWSADGASIAFVREARGVYQMKADGTGERRIAAGASSPAWSPDGRTIAFVRQDSVWFMDPEGKNKRRAPGLPRSVVSSVAWSPDGRHLAFERYDRPRTRGVHVVALDGTQRRHVLWAADPPAGYAWGPP